MKTDYTHISVILDRSGSMHSIRPDIEGGFDRFIADQRALPGECTVSLAQFDNRYETVLDRVPIAAVPPLHLEPRGMTALLDAIGRTVNRTRHSLAALAEGDRPTRVLLVIVTDGYENASRRMTYESVKSLLEERQKVAGWQVLFLAANLDAAQEGARFGVDADAALSFVADSQGSSDAWRSASISTTAFRTRRAAKATFTKDDADKQQRADA